MFLPMGSLGSLAYNVRRTSAVRTASDRRSTAYFHFRRLITMDFRFDCGGFPFDYGRFPFDYGAFLFSAFGYNGFPFDYGGFPFDYAGFPP